MSKLHSKRMVLIPEELVSLLRERQQETVSPVTQNLVSLKGQMSDILDRPDLRSDVKAKLYNQAFQRYQNVREQAEHKPLAVQILPSIKDEPETGAAVSVAGERESGFDPIASEIIQSVPKTLKNRAELLLQKLKQYGDVINWNDRGELVFNGKQVQGTNVLDLVNDVLRNRKTSSPRGWEYFARGLAHMNIPNELIQNAKRRRVIQQYKQEPATTLQPRDYEQEGDQEWTDEEILPEEDTGLNRLLSTPAVRKRKADDKTPRRKRSGLGAIKKRLARWSPLPYKD